MLSQSDSTNLSGESVNTTITDNVVDMHMQQSITITVHMVLNWPADQKLISAFDLSDSFLSSAISMYFLWFSYKSDFKSKYHIDFLENCRYAYNL